MRPQPADVDGDGRADLMIAITGDVTGARLNLSTGPGDLNGGWVLWGRQTCP